MEPGDDHFLNFMYDDIEAEDIFLFRNATSPKVLSVGDIQDEYPLSDEDMFDLGLQRVDSGDSDPRSITSSEPALAAIQRRLIEVEDIPIRPNPPRPWSSAASNRLSQTSFQDQDQDLLELAARSTTNDDDDDDAPQLGDSANLDVPITLPNSRQDAHTNEAGDAPSPDANGQLSSNRKRPRTATDASLSANHGFAGPKSRKTTLIPGDDGGPSAAPSDLPLSELFAFPDDFEEIEREQREAENWLKKKKEQERLDEEYARSLQQHWNEEFYASSSSTSMQNFSKKPLNAKYHSTLPVHGEGNSSKFNESYIEITSDSELEEVYPKAVYASSSRSASSRHNPRSNTSDMRGHWSKADVIDATSSSFSTLSQYKNGTTPRDQGIGYPTYSINSTASENPNILRAQLGATYNPIGTLGYQSSPFENDLRNPVPNGYSNGYLDGVVDLISKASSELETHGMNSSNFKSTIYEQITPKTTTEELKKLLENIRPDQDLDCNREGTPEALRFNLMEHQKLGLAWMKSMEECSNRGGILADDMGLGKTIQALALIVSRPSKDPEQKTTLIVAPVALIQQWKREIERMLKPNHQLRVFILHNERGAKYCNLKKYDVVLTTYGTLSSELKRLEYSREMLTENQLAHPYYDSADMFSLPLLGERSVWYRVIVDEAQCIRNKATRAAQACYRLKSTYRWCMTGTPMMNNVSELYSLIKFLRIGPYNVLEKFNSTFTNQLQRNDIPPNYPPMQQFQALLKAILLRRTKSSKIDGKMILHLPPRTTEKTYAVFSEDEKSLYEGLESKTQIRFNRYLDEGTIGRNYSNILVLLLRLRQACCHPHLIDDLGVEANAATAKIDLIENAKRFQPNVVARLRDSADLECPVCIDVAENAVIFFPCGHSTCAECFAIISDPARGLMQGNDGYVCIKCPQCRTLIDPKKITDHVSFTKVFCLDSTDADGEETPGPVLTGNEDSDDIGKGKGKAVERKSLPQLKKNAARSAEAKREYMRYLTDNWVTSAKIEKTMEILRDIQSRIPEGDDKPEKTIVFSQFTSLLDLLQVPIEREGWGYCRYDGSMQPSHRNEAVLRFSDSQNHTIMLISLKAGNSGLNLVAASQVIILDPFWNPYLEEQAIDRAHRIGQMRPVMVHRILVHKTVEDRILELQDRKRALIEGALDETASKSIGRLNTRELAFLFGVAAPT
ncbi:RING-13 protein [Histoplasma capsulatum H143]|uniref:RING-13 protein n=1 Tax=Ajellomyces capsulatus (strain H143) TaxID=544712 RepID=C6H6G7_AJECH|nr:RING-13 protein [Histoplasma capsulatum H143]